MSVAKHAKLEPSKIQARGDPHSVANTSSFLIEHISFNWLIDFEAQGLSGKAVYKIKKIGKGDRIFFDIKGIKIIDVYMKHGSPLSYSYAKNKNDFGGQFTVILGIEDEYEDKKIEGSAEGEATEVINLVIKEQELTLTIEYSTVDSSAMQWAPKEQTLSGKYPFMFTQCQSIHARSLFPCQDTPSVKFTFDAQVSVAAPYSDLTVLMGANEMEKTETGYSFKQTTRIPSYLMAIAVGNLKSKEIGPRSRVWTEPEQVESAAFEFSETESFLKTAEEVAGPYRWGRYDLLVLPSSFPYGGMENPCLTFLSPSLLAGDRSLADVVAHEISHAWTGNLVTNRTWEHFWLNEGWTMFLERKITGKLRGESYRHFDALLGLNDLRDSVKHMTERNIDTSLYPDLSSTHPDDAFSTVPYEKGHSLLFCLEQEVNLKYKEKNPDGDSQIFDQFIKDYLDSFSGGVVDVSDFISFVNSWCQQRDITISFDWDKWLLVPGMPKDIPKYDESVKNVCIAFVDRICNQGIVDSIPAGFSPGQVVYCLDALLERDLSIELFSILESVWKLQNTNNVEIRQKYLLCGVNLGIRFSEALEFVGQHGRMKYHRPIYQALYAQSDESRRMAIDFFQANRSKYHPIAIKLLEKDLNLSKN
jgi:leukotriene-A4 hydrolase